MSERIMTASDVTIDYPAHSVSPAHTAVKGFTLAVEPGEIIGLVGSSGSGKSTIAEVISGSAASAPARVGAPKIVGGTLSVLGYDLKRTRGRKLNRLTFGIGFLRQDGGSTLTSNMTVAEIIAEPLFLRDKHFDAREAGLKAATLLDSLLLPVGMLNMLPHELSSGQRQRVALARALVMDPVLLVADEPTAGIDVSVRGQVVDVVAGLQRGRGASAVIISHDLDVLRRSVDRIAVLHEGMVVGLGTIDEVLGDPRHPYVQGLARTRTDDSEAR